MSIYLFSILDNISGTTQFLAFIFILIMIALIIIGSMWACEECWILKDIRIPIKLFKISILCFITSILFAIIATFIPTQNSLIKSYIVINGKSQLTNKNIERVIKAIDQKTDNIIDAFSKK